MSSTRHVALVGLPGAGKTSVGRRLSKELQRPFADLDEQIELTAGLTIPTLFRDQGEDVFRRLETQVLADLLDRPRPLVIAAGGGAVNQAENRELLTAHATVVWLRGAATFLAARTDPTHRPLLAEDPQGTYARLETDRTVLYDEVADHVVDVEPFHGLDDEPRRLLARHIAELLTAAAPQESDA